MYRNRTDNAKIDIAAYIEKGKLERSKMATSLLSSGIKGASKLFGALVSKTEVNHRQAHC